VCWLRSFDFGVFFGQNRSLGCCAWVYFNELWTSGWAGGYSGCFKDATVLYRILGRNVPLSSPNQTAFCER